MFRKLFLVAVAAFLAGCGTMKSQGLSPLARSIEDRYQFAVVGVVASYGNSFVIGADGILKRKPSLQSTGVATCDLRHVLVNHHGVSSGPSAISLFPGDGHRYEARMVWKDATIDAALFEITSEKPLPACVSFEYNPPLSGDRVVSMGYPKGRWTVSDGIWGGGSGAYDSKTASGSSGSALFNESGRIVGLKRTQGYAEFYSGDGIRVPRTVSMRLRTPYSDVVTIAEFCEAYGRCAELSAPGPVVTRMQ